VLESAHPLLAIKCLIGKLPATDGLKEFPLRCKPENVPPLVCGINKNEEEPLHITPDGIAKLGLGL
jgi:hypothetical protein